jgi:hypothetical protein
MTIRVACPGCGAAFSFADDARGKTGRCKKCQETFEVQEKPPAVEPEEPAPTPVPEEAGTPAARRPARKKKRKRAAKEWDSGRVIYFSMLGVAALIVLGGIGGLVAWLALRPGPGGGDQADDVLPVRLSNFRAYRGPDTVFLVDYELKEVQEEKIAAGYTLLIKSPRDKYLDLTGTIIPRKGTFRTSFALQGEEGPFSVSVTVQEGSMGNKPISEKVWASNTLVLDTIPFGTDPAERGKNPEGMELKEEEVAALLEQVRGKDVLKQHEALTRLRGARPTVRRDEVAAVLDGLLASAPVGTRQLILQVLAVWGVPEKNGPAVVKQLADRDHFIQEATLALCAKWKLKEAVAPAAAVLTSGNTGAATKMLMALGPIAEAEVLRYIKFDQPHTRLQVCRVLNVIGTQKSIGPLQGATLDSDQRVANAAKEALYAVRHRQKE